jgi:conjugal transfer/entry exclusion protein
MVRVTAPVEYDLSQPFCQSALSDQLAHTRSLLGLVEAVQLPAQLGIQRRRCDQRIPQLVIDDLRINVLQAAKYIQTRALGRAMKALAETLMPAIASFPTRVFGH